jgi:hypothetical protein
LRPQDLAVEASLISAVSECLVIRVFLQWVAMQQYGWLLCIANHADIDKAKEGSRVLIRILTSVACMTGACTQIPNVEEKEIVMTSCRHALLPHQRGQGFYRYLLTAINIITHGQLAGTDPQDFTMVELDAGVAEVITLLGQLPAAVSVADAKTRWLGSIVAVPKCRSNVQRVELASRAIAKLAVASSRLAKRMLGEQLSPLPPTVGDICRVIPEAPAPPRSLVKVRPIDPAVHIHPCSGGTFDADAAQPVERESQCSIDKFDMWLPDSLALLRQCQRDSVMVAPSSFLEGDVGLYPTRDFKQADIICQGVAFTGKWERCNGGMPMDKRHTLLIELVRRFRTHQRYSLSALVERHPWAAMNAACATSGPANVEPVIHGGLMNNQFLVFRAKMDIPAYSGELLWS